MVEKRDEIIGKDMEVIQPYFNIIRIFIGKLIVQVRCPPVHSDMIIKRPKGERWFPARYASF